MKQAILIIGGYNSIWPAYLEMARHLEDLTGLQAVAVPLMPWDWWAAERDRDATNLLRKLKETVIWARRRVKAGRFILVGHSAGGIAARLYLHDQPVWDQVYAGLDHVTTVVSLGSPHCGHGQGEAGWFLIDKANQLVPGTPHDSRVRYIAVAGRFLQGHKDGRYSERRAFRAYRFLCGKGDTWGDGLVPVSCAELVGAEQLVLPGVAHSRKVSGAWYGGTKAIIKRWWPDGAGRAR